MTVSEPRGALGVAMVLAILGLAVGSAALAMEAIELPDPSGLEPSVAAQLAEARELLLPEAESSDAPANARAEAWGKLGSHYHAYGFGKTAAGCYRNASELSPEEMRWHYYLGRLLQEDGDLEGARIALEAALVSAPGYLPTLHALAEIELELNRIEAAESYLSRILENHPLSASALALRGQIAVSQQDWDGAIKDLETALAQVPEADRLHYLLGLAYRGRGDLEQAREHLALRGSVGVRPPDPLMDDLRQLAGGEAVHLLRGRQAFRMGRYREAVEAFRAAAEASPESSRALVDLGAALGAQGETAAAVAELERAVALDPGNPYAHYNLGVLLVKQGQPDEAVRHLSRSVELDPQDVAARIELARTLRLYERFDLALPFYQSALQLDPDSQESRVGLAECLVRLGRFAEAGEQLEEAHRLEPTNGQVAHSLARLLAGAPDQSLRDGERALELATKVFRASPTGFHAETVAMALAETERCADAAGWQRQALSAAEPQGDSRRTEELRRVLEIYAAGPPCRYVSAAGDAD